MEALSMLAPSEKSVRGKLQLFLRLWVARQKYESLRPYGDKPAQRVRFHLEQLQGCWDHVLEFQKALAMEVEHFAPTDKFELIYVITSFVDRELHEKSNALIGVQARWSAYQSALRRLNYQMNRYEFADGCLRCQQIITDMQKPHEPEPAPIIPFRLQQLAKVQGYDHPELKMRDLPPTEKSETEEAHSDSGLSRYSPGGKFS
ncbi:MAG: hypothetical protein ACXW3Z_11285 [Limisphaerales bacterium]